MSLNKGNRWDSEQVAPTGFDFPGDSRHSKAPARQVLHPGNQHLPAENLSLACGKFPAIIASETALRANHTATSTLNHTSDADRSLQGFQNKLYFFFFTTPLI